MTASPLGNYVYVWFIGGKPRYVGRGTGRRGMSHRLTARRTSDLNRAIRKAAAHGVSSALQIVEQDLTIEQASVLERHCVKSLLAIDEQLLNRKLR